MDIETLTNDDLLAAEELVGVRQALYQANLANADLQNQVAFLRLEVERLLTENNSLRFHVQMYQNTTQNVQPAYVGPAPGDYLREPQNIIALGAAATEDA